MAPTYSEGAGHCGGEKSGEKFSSIFILLLSRQRRRAKLLSYFVWKKGAVRVSKMKILIVLSVITTVALKFVTGELDTNEKCPNFLNVPQLFEFDDVRINC